MPNQGNVRQRKGDPYIYLRVGNEWYCYNPMEPSLGGGAMGDVYRGYRCSNGAMIAVKRVKDQYANNPMIRQRAQLEANLAFRHPNLVEMIGYCEYAPNYGPIFILSNYVHGEDIDTYVGKMANMPNRVEKISDAICSVLDALDYIHSKGVYHRDVKPSNIMIENGNNVRLMDLGIARTNNSGHTSNGFIGTPEYSAPEQMKSGKDGAVVKIDATTDIYELGVTFYELLTGKNPMKCDTEVDTLSKQMEEPLPSSSVIPKRLMRVIWKATEKEQYKRYQTAMEFKDAIKDAINVSPSPWEQMIEWMSSHLIVIITIAVLFIVVIAGIIYTLI